MLPEDGPSEDCPPCNPGMQLSADGTCQFCPANHFSSGSEPCRQCPGSTAPDTRLVFKWWNNLPEEAGISSSCITETGKTLVSAAASVWSGSTLVIVKQVCMCD